MRKRIRWSRFIVFLSFASVVALVFVLRSQDEKLKEIAAEKAELEQQYLALQNEEQRLEFMIEYAGTKEYLLQYAREKLGFVSPEDYKFDLGEEPLP